MKGTISKTEIEKGHKTYNKSVLQVYDILVIYFSNTFAWKYHRNRNLALFTENLGEHHLEIGAGTGYYLLHSLPNNDTKEVTLFDLNENCLKRVSNALLSNVEVNIIIGNIFKPVLNKKFDSIAVNYVLHCIPGSVDDKIQTLANLSAYLKGKGILFGSTILNPGPADNLLSQGLKTFYNRKGIFHNLNDSLVAMEAAFKNKLKKYELTVIGNVLEFKIWK